MKAHRNIIFDVRLKAFSYDQEQDKPLSSLLFNPVLEVLTRTIRQERAFKLERNRTISIYG